MGIPCVVVYMWYILRNKNQPAALHVRRVCVQSVQFQELKSKTLLHHRASVWEYQEPYAPCCSAACPTLFKGCGIYIWIR